MVIKMRLGKTNLEVNKNGFGALPIQRRNIDDSVEILLHAYENGIDFYDTAHFYTDSEAKLGKAFEDVRENIYLASKGAAEEVEEEMEKLCREVNEAKGDPLKIAAYLHLRFETIHPFLDGNGRVGRLLITLFLITQRVITSPVLYLSCFLKLNRIEYYDRIRKHK